MTAPMPSLCEACARMREVISGRGSRFLLCEHSRADPSFPKYPPQPVVRCGAYLSRRGQSSEDRSGH